MSISNTSAVSAGLQILSTDGLLPSNVTPQQLKSATPGQLLELEIDNVETSTMSSLFGGAGSPSNNAGLNGSSSDGSNSTAESLVQALDAQIGNSSNPSTSGTTTSTATGNPASDTIGTLFSLLG